MRFTSGDGEDDPLALPPPLLLVGQASRGVGEEHHFLLALQLALEELQGGAVEAHQVLDPGGKQKRMWMSTQRGRWGCDRSWVGWPYAHVLHFGERVGAQVVHHREELHAAGDPTEMNSEGRTVEQEAVQILYAEAGPSLCW